MNARISRIAVLFLLVGSACGYSRPTLRAKLGEYDQERVRARALVPEAPAVILREALYMTHDARGGLHTSYEYHQAVLIQRPEGVAYANAHLPISDDFEYMLIEAETRLPNGEVIRVDPADMIDHEVMRYGGSREKSRRLRSFAFPRARVGAIVELHYVAAHGAIHVENRFALNAELPVLSAHFELEAYPGYNLKVQDVGFDRKLETADQRARAVFDLHQPFLGRPRDILAPLPGEWTPQAAFSVTNPNLFFTPPIKDWSSLGAYLSAAQDEESALADIGVRGLPEKQRIAKIWQFVQDELEDRGGVVSSREQWSVDRIIKNRRATSAERARVMMTMLQRAGLTVHPVWIGPAAQPSLQEDFPYRGVSDGDLLAMVVLDGSKIILDPDCTGCAAGNIAFEHAGRTALVVRKLTDNALKNYSVDLIDIPAGETARRAYSRELELEKTALGLTAKSGRWEFSGPSAGRFRHVVGRYGSVIRERALRDMLLLEEEGGSLSLEGTEPSLGPMIIRAKDVPLKRASYTEVANRFMITPDELAPFSWLRTLANKRRVDLLLGVVPSENNTWRVRTPEGCVWDAPNEPVLLDTRFGRYTLNAKPGTDQLTLVESMALKQERIAIADLEGWNQFLGEVARHRTRPFICRFAR